MLFKPHRGPLDRTSRRVTNRVVNERVDITQDKDRIFALSKGPYFTESLEVRDGLTGDLLVRDVDYQPLHFFRSATEYTSKEVCSLVYITKVNVSSVSVSYYFVGGRYSTMVEPLLDFLEIYKDTSLPTISFPTISGLPTEFDPTPHEHSFFDMDDLEDLVTAIDGIVEALYERDTPKWQAVYDALALAIAQMNSEIGALLDALNMRINLIRLQRFDVGDFYLTDSSVDPKTSLEYGDWTKNPNILLYGTDVGDDVGGLIDVDQSSDLVARMTNLWQRIADVNPITYALSASSTSVSEGDSVTVTLTTTGLPSGTSIPYTISGIQSNDISNPLSGNFVINGSGVASVTINVLNDAIEEGVEQLLLKLNNGLAQVTVNINDATVSKKLTLKLLASSFDGNDPINTLTSMTQVDEGSHFYIVLRYENLQNGDTIHFFYQGSANISGPVESRDFLDVNGDPLVPYSYYGIDNSNSGTRVVNFYVGVKDDFVTEGVETLVIKAGLTNNATQALVSASININDTSKTPTYTARFSGQSNGSGTITDVNEGTTFYLVVETTNLPDNSIVALNWGGTTEADDFSTVLPIAASIVGNKAILAITTASDLKTEGTETLRVNIMVNGSAIASSTINVLDTSNSENIAVKFSSNSSGTNSITEVNEGSKAYLIINTTAIPDGTIYDLVYEGGATASDFDETRLSSVTINNNRAVVQYSFKADNASEGDEIFRVRVRSGSTDVATAQLVIKDTSSAPTYSLRYSSASDGVGTITNSNEGTVIYAVVETTNVSNGTVLGLTYVIGGLVATVANGDVTVTPPSNVTIQNNKGIAAISLRNDGTSEGAEVLVTSLRATASPTSSVLQTANLTINDTSTTPAYSSKFSANSDGTGSISGNTIPRAGWDVPFYFVLQFGGIPNGTTYWLTATGVNTGDMLTNAPSTMTIQDGVAIATLRAAIDYTVPAPANKTYKISVYSDSAKTNKVAESTVILASPTYSLKFSSLASGNNTITTASEGDTIYAVMDTTNFPDGQKLNLSLGRFSTEYPYVEVSLDNSGINNAVDTTGPTHTEVVVTNNRAIVSFTIRNDLTTEGTETYYANITGISQYRVDANTTVDKRNVLLASTSMSVLDTSPAPETVVTISRDVNNGLNALSEFMTVVGRAPNEYEHIRFVLAQGYTLRGTTSLTKIRTTAGGNVTTPIPGNPGIKFAGFPTGVDITLDVNGTIVGAPGTGSTFGIFNGEFVTLGGDIFQPCAIDTDISLKVNVFSTGELLGGGAGVTDDIYSTGERNNGGDVVSCRTLGKTVTITNYGLVAGGGGAGGLAGGFVGYGNLFGVPTYGARGGAGAPYGSARLAFTSTTNDNAYTLYPDIPAQAATRPQAESIQGIGDATNWGRHATKYTGGQGGERCNGNLSLNMWDGAGGNGGAPGYSGNNGDNGGASSTSYGRTGGKPGYLSHSLSIGQVIIGNFGSGITRVRPLG